MSLLRGGLRERDDFAGAVVFEVEETVVEFLERGAVADADECDAGGAQLFVEESFVFLVECAGGFVVRKIADFEVRH